jgi:tetratricopeptide (TPR) repeat protein
LSEHDSLKALTFNLFLQNTLDEIGIQLFAKEDFQEALVAFSEAQKIRSTHFGSTHPTISMVLNNIACCRFSEGNHKQAWLTFLEAREIQQKTAQADLDLLHVGITLSNLGYVLIQMRQYEQAQEMFEEALLVSSACSIDLAAQLSSCLIYR